MNPQPHQIKGAEWALMTVRKYGLAYLAWEERTRKTLTALLAVENSKAKNCLIITKKKAIPGWEETLEKWAHSTTFTVVNYESVHKKLPIYDFIILDESHHAISGIGKPSKTWKAVFKFTRNKPILYLSATPYAEHVGLLYHQLRLSTWTPFKEKTFYDWYRIHGIPHMTRTPYGMKDKRDVYKTDDVLEIVKHLFDFKTRKQVGIKHEPTSNVITILPYPETLRLLKEWKKTKVITIGDYEILGDSDPKVRTVHYQLEGGSLKIDQRTSIAIHPGIPEKIKYIRDNYDVGSTAVMAHFIKERELLEKWLPGIRVLSSDGHAEGVDLSMYAKLVVYSMSFRTSKHTQRMARQANHDRRDPIEVDVLVMGKPAVGSEVYKTVATKKENFLKSSYDRCWD